MRHILLPTDFSETSWNAIKYALELLKKEACTFHLFNVYIPVIYHMEYVLGNPAQFGIVDDEHDTSNKSLKQLVDQIKADFDNPLHTFETIARFDGLVPGIQDMVIERDIELIIMGTTGATGLKEVLFGSNTVQVFQHVKCPVLAIPTNFVYQAPSELLFPTDLKADYATTPFELLQTILKAHHTRLHIMHVSNGYALNPIEKNKQLDLERIFKDSPYLLHNVECMDIEDAISKFQKHYKIDMLVMINNRHSFFERAFLKNTVNHIGFHLTIPLLVLPPDVLK